jgi:hypothetical protein
MSSKTTQRKGEQAIPFGAVYETIETPPELGYDPPIRVIIRANPTAGDWERWNEANAMAPTKPDKPIAEAVDQAEADRLEREWARYHRDTATRRLLICKALCTLYHRTPEVCPELDFSTERSTEILWDNKDIPDELWLWLLSLPWDVVARRREIIMGKTNRASS